MFIDYTDQLPPLGDYRKNTDGPFWRAVTKYLDKGDRSALTEAVQRARGEIVGRDPEPVIVVPKKRSGRRVIKRVVKRAFRN